MLEDQEFFREFAKELLDKNYDVAVSGTIKEAIAVAQQHRPELFIVDLNLDNGETGGQFLEMIKTWKIPSIIMTGDWDETRNGPEWPALKALGAVDLVAKSMQMEEELIRKVQVALGEYTEETSLN